jgi:CHRD domain-containing protein
MGEGVSLRSISRDERPADAGSLAQPVREDAMRRDKLITAVLLATFVVFSAGYAYAEEFSARVNGFQEVGGVGAGQTGAIRTNGNGTFHLELDKNGTQATYTLTYSDLGSPPTPANRTVTQAHIHFGKRHVGGGILVFLCANVPTAPAGTQPCPANSGTVTGTLLPANVLAIAGQNVTAGDFDALVDALRSNTAYVNVHTTGFPAGEIRGQIRKDRRDHDDKHDDDQHGK